MRGLCEGDPDRAGRAEVGRGLMSYQGAAVRYCDRCRGRCQILPGGPAAGARILGADSAIRADEPG